MSAQAERQLWIFSFFGNFCLGCSWFVFLSKC